jgi:hypothetical protein
MHHAAESYFKKLHEIRSTGASVPETSYYPALAELLDTVGGELKPKVCCVSDIADIGAGRPDFGLFAAHQLQKSKVAAPLADQHPERGVVEVKSTKDDSWVTADGRQVAKYWGHYRQVLVTNYRDFVFVGEDENGEPRKLETLRLAGSESAFWTKCVHPQKFADETGERLVEYLRRVMLNVATIVDPESLAWFLASYAREAKARVEAAKDLPSLAALREALEASLGMKFAADPLKPKECEQGERFFRATLVQTLFYGVFSSWVLWARENGGKKGVRFNWHEAHWKLHVPIIASLFEQIATRNKLESLGLVELMDWTGMALNRVDPERFFQKFEEDHAVQYFYEPFLKAYDPDLRKALGVWYTPPEIVKYQVARVDKMLRGELDIPDGLADPSVYVLDPCCGTGAYLVEVLRSIHETLEAKGGGALTAHKLKKAALERVFGFEILPAPFVVSHLQLGLLLRKFGAPLASERAAVYLTNALTGWEPPQGPKTKLPFPELEEERDAAERVKRDVPILVILGNPPYNAFAGTSPQEEEGLVECYKEKLNTPVDEGGWGIRKFNLDELYIRFFRIAERRIVTGGKGIVCYISNFSYLSDPSFVVMREQFLQEFDKLWFDCMNGDSRETGKRTPEGKPDPSVFSTEQNKEGIRVGTAICLMVRKSERAAKPTVLFRDFWGVNKRGELLDSLAAQDFEKQYETATPSKENRHSFRPSDTSSMYASWPSVSELCMIDPYNGPIERRGSALISIEKEPLLNRIRAYFDPSVSDEEVRLIHASLMMTGNRIVGTEARTKIRKEFVFDPSRVVRYPVRPFDVRWCYLENLRPLFSEPSPQLLEHSTIPSNKYIVVRENSVTEPTSAPLLYSELVCDYHCLAVEARHIPLLLRREPRNPKRGKSQSSLLGESTQVVANLSPLARNYLASIGVDNPDEAEETAALIWMHTLAIGYSPAYLAENADGIRQDWPRVPLPKTKGILLASAHLGRQLASLLDTERPVAGVTMGAIRSELKVVGVIARVGGGALNPDVGDLDVTVGWGHSGKDRATMPGRGRLAERAYTSDELAALQTGAKSLKLTLTDLLAVLGKTTYDVYLNEVTYWRCIPTCVWDYTIGGYQVIKKWLSYREKKLLGRPLKIEEVEYVTEMCRRLTMLIVLQPECDHNYETVKANPSSAST